MAFEAYSVAIKLSLVNGVSSGLGMLSSQFKALNKDAELFSARLETVKRIATSGALMTGAGLGILHMFKTPLDDARKLQTEVARFASLGFGDKINQQALQYASGMKTFGTSTAENLTLVSDAMAVFKNLHHAEFAAPLMAKMKFANQAVFGAEHGGANERKFMDMLKVIEFRGGLSSEREFFTQADYVQKVISGSRNRVDASQLLQALKTGGLALSRRDNDKFYLGSEPLIQEFGGQRYGTGAMAIYQNLVQARGTITAQQELYRLGLLNPALVEFNKLGQLKKARAGAFIGSDILEREGELALLQKVLLPAFASHGITGDENIIREIGMVLGNRTGSALMGRIYQQLPTLLKQIDANKSAMGINQLDAKARTTYDGQIIQLHAQWRDLMTQLGVAVLPAALDVLGKVNSGLYVLNDFLKRNGDGAKALAQDMFYLGGALAIGGTIRLTTGAFKGLALASDMARLKAVRSAAGVTEFAGAVADIERKGKLASATSGLIGFTGALTKIGFALLVVPDLIKAAADAGTYVGTWLGNWQKQRDKEKEAYRPGQGLGLMDGYQGGPTLASAQALSSGWQPYHIPQNPYPTGNSGNNFQFTTPTDFRSITGSSLATPVPAGRQPVNVTVNASIDGKPVANRAVEIIVDGMRKPPTGASTFDRSMGLLHPGSPSLMTR
ncbi:hypothetical protein QU487_13405 [Crenobacter sp. SG2305]|uniref:hypothetical protein n=1 Tax=Crenobacter oryzisoli TaxID=3056844 RepID=UPI0025AB5B4E|nr:hypothetical protein [Crenobacter sp. SG2305]MDN0083744.1 hypothetical protein [Crenobacter sp. SG2305]